MLAVLILVCTLVLAYFIGNEFKTIAEMKGHDGSRYFWWSFLLGPVGYLMVVALPDRKGNAEKPVSLIDDATSIVDELPEL